jgi:hypothetical protein
LQISFPILPFFAGGKYEMYGIKAGLPEAVFRNLAVKGPNIAVTDDCGHTDLAKGGGFCA